MFKRMSILAGLFGLVILQYTHSHYLDKLNAEINSTKTQFVEEVFATQSQLASRLRSITEDPVLTKNLNWGLMHSVNKELERQLTRYVLEEIQLVDAHCNILARVSVSTPLWDSCALPDAMTSKVQQFVWEQTQTSSTLSLILPMTVMQGIQIYVAGIVRFDNAWLSAFPSLAHYKKRFNLSISNGSHDQRTQLVGSAPPQLSTDSWYFRILPGLHLASWYQNPPLAHGSLILLFITTMLVFFWQSGQRVALLEKNWQSFADKVKQYTSGGDDTGGNSSSEVEQWIFAFCQHATQQQTQLRQHVSDLQTQIEAKEAIIVEQEMRLDQIAIQSSVSEVWSTNQDRLQQALSHCQSSLEDLGDIGSQGIRRSIETILALIRSWQSETARRGARKFWRSMIETRTEDGQTLMEENLERLEAAGQLINDQLLNQSLLLEQIKSHLLTLGQFDQQVRATLLPEQSVPPESAIDVIGRAQHLIDPNEDILFDNQLPLNDTVALVPPVPSGVLVSALAMLYRMLKRRSKNAITTQVRVSKMGQAMWILSTKVENSSNNASLEKVASLLKPYPVSLATLPLGEDYWSVALQWLPHHESRTKPNIPSVMRG